ncbi:MAG: PD-(D/E)XK nuclease family protein [Candidatus Nanopelagicales bacterium]
MTTKCDGPKPIKISWSALQAHTACKQRAFLFREKKKNPVTNIRPFFHGTVADRVMRRWLEADQQVPGEMATWVDFMIDHEIEEAKRTSDGVVNWKSDTDRAEMAEWVRQLVTRLEPFLLKEVIPYEYEPEARFRVPLRIPDLNGETAQIMLVGGMDILVRESKLPPVWAAYDLKATANPDYLRKTLGQGVFYSLAHYAREGVPLRTFAFVQPMVETNPIAYVDITDADLSSMMARIVAMAHDIWRGDTEPNKDDKACSWCPVRHACAKYRPTSTGVFRPKQKVAK